MTVAELAGGISHPVRDIRVESYVSANPTEDEKEIRGMLSRVWQGEFNYAECFQMWDEMPSWRCSAAVEFYIGAPEELITDGSHVYFKDQDGKSWFLRLLPAAQ
jgi:hypothetical protein